MIKKKKIIKFDLNGKIIFSKPLQLNDNLAFVREKIKKRMNCSFQFLDKDNNLVYVNDENDFIIEDILNNGQIKLKQVIIDSPSQTPIPTIKKINDFSKYKVIGKEDNLTLYKYSNKENQTNRKYVYQYFYDEFNINDYDNAYVLLLCGEIGSGKTTAINAFFNILKGIKFEDNYRFILITEQNEEKKWYKLGTEGIHIYYLKDYNNKPIIIIDSEGYNDCRSSYHESMINEILKYVFSNIINHINTVCFCMRLGSYRIPVLAKYIFNYVSSFFSENITENFIILSTFANRDIIKKVPEFIDWMKSYEDFLNIQTRGEDDKWLFAFDSKCVLDKEEEVEDRLTKYSFSQLNKLYEEKIKNLRPKGIKKYTEVLETRYQFKIIVNLLNNTFQNLLMKQTNLQEKEKNINIINKKIEDLQIKIKNFEDECKNLSPEEIEKKLEELNNEINNKINNINIETIDEYVNLCEYNDLKIYTHCDSCKRNCHDICDCIGNNLDKCKRFNFGIYEDKRCDECGCLKEKHKQDHYHWVKKPMNKKIENAHKIKEEKEKEKYLEEINQKKNDKSNFEELIHNKNILMEEKNKTIKEINEIKEKIKNISNQITYIIIKLKNISQKMEDITMNRSHLKTIDEYIDSLKDKMEEIGLKDEEQKRDLKKMKENIKNFKEVNQLKEDEMMNLNESQLTEKLEIIAPKLKNSN